MRQTFEFYNQYRGLVDELENILMVKIQEYDTKSQLERDLLDIISWANKNNIPEDKMPRDQKELYYIETLCLSGLDLHYIPDNIGILKNLKYISVNSNKIQTIPNSLFRLTELRKLDISSNNITILQEEIKNLTNLSDLDISCNKIVDLPYGIYELNNLINLNISNNQISYLNFYYELCNLIKLETMDLSKNKVNYSIGNGFNRLPKLKKINASGNNARYLSTEIFDLVNLCYLDISENRIIGFPCPENIANLHNLEYLDVSYNQFEMLPDEICNLYNIKVLKIQKNNFQKIPKCLSYFGDNIIDNKSYVSCEIFQQVAIYENKIKKSEQEHIQFWAEIEKRDEKRKRLEKSDIFEHIKQFFS